MDGVCWVLSPESLGFLFNCYDYLLPWVSRFLLVFTVCAVTLVFVSILAASPHKQSWKVSLSICTPSQDGPTAWLLRLASIPPASPPSPASIRRMIELKEKTVAS